jgi:hypothetical protein
MAGLFELAGIPAVLGSSGLIFDIVMSVVQDISIVAAAVARSRWSRTVDQSSSTAA